MYTSIIGKNNENHNNIVNIDLPVSSNRIPIHNPLNSLTFTPYFLTFMCDEPKNERKSATILLIGMAGSGKTTFMQRINSYIYQHSKNDYIINLDPAVSHIPYSPNIDIRDTVNCKQVMSDYNLGPNGAILTSLNLFTTKFGDVMNILDERAKEDIDYILLDTPGQIEIFTWSASGSIITESLASSFPTVITYIIDTAKASSPTTFMSNMLYACSVMYKTKLPMVLVCNKCDIVEFEVIKEWMTDFESFQEAVSRDTSFMSSLVTSMGLVLEEFYECMKIVGCSAVTGEGIEEYFKLIDESIKEYEIEYKPEMDRLKLNKLDNENKEKSKMLSSFMQDLNIGK